MIPERKQKELLEKIKNIELEIQNVYYTEDFSTANQFELRLSSIKNSLFSINVDRGFFNDANSDYSLEVEQQLEVLETDIIDFLKEKALSIDLHEKNTEDLWDTLKEISDVHKKDNYSIIEEQEYNRDMATRVLEIFGIQARRGEEIDLFQVYQYCKAEDFLFVIKQKLINLAIKQDSSTQKSTLKLAKNLNIDNICNPEPWKVLFQVNGINLVGNLSKYEDIKKEQTQALVVSQPKRSFLEIIKNKIVRTKNIDIPKTTIYTFGDINPDTLEWENIEIVIDEFPKNFSQKQVRRLLAIEINDVPYVMQEHELGKYPNLQTITFGKGVKSIGENVLSYVGDFKYITEYFNLNELKNRFPKNYYSSYYFGQDVFHYLDYKHAEFVLSYKGLAPDFFSTSSIKKCLYHSFVKEIKISDSVTDLETNAFSYLPELQSITFGSGITVIPDNCCQYCDNLKEIKFPNTLQEIGINAFHQGYFPRSKNSSSPEYIRILVHHYTDGEIWNESNDISPTLSVLRKPLLKKYDAIKKYDNIVKIPESVEKIGEFAFYSCYECQDQEQSWITNKANYSDSTRLITKFPKILNNTNSNDSKFSLLLTKKQSKLLKNVPECLSGRSIIVHKNRFYEQPKSTELEIIVQDVQKEDKFEER